MPKVLITGIAGFLGAALCRRLREEGWEVSGIDLVPRSGTWRLEGLKIEYLWGSCQDLHIVEYPFVVHCAAVADVPFALASPIFTLQQNVMGAAALMEACARYDGFQRIVVMSSESVYGYAKTIPISEESPLNPSNIYGASKAAEELVTISYYHSHKLPVTVLRSSTLFGVGGRLQQAIPIFLSQALKGEPLTIHGDGQQSRDFNPVANLVDGIMLALNTPAAVGEVFNIGSGEETSIMALAQRCISVTRSSSSIKTLPQRPGEQNLRMVLDISKARRLLGYTPRQSFDEGLEETARWLSRMVGVLT